MVRPRQLPAITGSETIINQSALRQFCAIVRTLTLHPHHTSSGLPETGRALVAGDGPLTDSSIQSEQVLDYHRPDVWDRLTGALTAQFQPRPTDNRGIVDCPPGWRWRPNLTDYDLWFAVRGKGMLQLGTQQFPIAAGTLFLLRPGDAGWATQDPHDRLTVIFLHLGFIAPATGSMTEVPGSLLPDRCVPFDDLSAIEPLLMRIQRLLDSRQPLATMEATLTLQQALIHIYRQDAANHAIALPQFDSRIERVISHLRRFPHERTSLDQAAAIACLAPGYFSRLFTREMGTSFRNYVVVFRLERARYLLQETDMSVSEIAESLGYDSIFLFSRQFKSRYSLAPSRLRTTDPGFDV